MPTFERDQNEEVNQEQYEGGDKEDEEAKEIPTRKGKVVRDHG